MKLHAGSRTHRSVWPPEVIIMFLRPNTLHCQNLENQVRYGQVYD